MLFILNRDYQIMGVADNVSENTLHYFNDKLVTDLTSGVSTFEFDVYKNNPVSAYIQEGNYITFKDKTGKQLLFTIMEMEEDSSKKSVYCEDIGLDLLNETVVPIKPADAQPISWYIEKSIYDSGWEIGLNEISHLSRKLEYEGHTNALKRILSICNAFDNAEIDFTVEFNGNAVSKQLINIYKKRGNETGLRYNAGIDLVEARKSVSLNNLATALRGVGADITNDDNEVIGNVDFKDIVSDDGRYFTTKGSPFVFDRVANEQWSRYRNMESATKGYIVDSFIYDTKSNKELFNRALSHLKQRSEPAVEYEIEISKIKENLEIGDTIEVVDNDFQPALHLQARVLSISTSETVDSNNKLTLGNYKILQSSIEDRLLELQKQLNSAKISWSENNVPELKVTSTNGEAFFNNYIDTTINASIIRGGIDITNSYTSNDVVWSKRDRFGVTVPEWRRTGFSVPLSIEDINTKNTFVATVGDMNAQITIFNTLTSVESDTEPTTAQQGQIWVDTSKVPPVQKVFLGGKWKPVTPITEEQFDEVKSLTDLANSGVESVNKELGNIKTDVAKKVDSTTYTQKVGAIESALANKVEQSIQDAKNKLLEAEIANKVAQDEYETMIGELNGSIEAKVDGTVYNAQKALQDAEIAKKVAQEAYDAKVKELNTAIGKKLDTATANAQKAIQDAEIAKKVAQTTYDTKVSELETTLGKKLDTATAESQKKLQDAEIAKKVAQTAYDTKVAELNTAIGKKLDTSTATAQKLAQDAEIAKKVAKEDYDAKVSELDTAISGNEVRIGKTEEGLLAKASTTDVNALKTRMGKAETTISTNSKEIALKATQSDLDATKGRLDTAEASLVVQADEIASKVGKTEFNAVDNRLKTAESTITQQADMIESKVSQTTYDTDIEGIQADVAGKASTDDVNALKTRVSKSETAITQTEKDIALRAKQTDLDLLGKRVGTAESSIVVNANAIKTKVEQSTFNSANQRLTNAESTITQHAGKIATKVEQDDFDKVEGRVKSAETTLTQQAGEIALRAKQADLDTTNTKLGTAESELVLQADKIASKVEQTDFDKVENRVKSAESSITQQAGLIESKVSKTTYDTDIQKVKTDVAGKASNTDVNALKGRVSTAETKITQTEKDILLKATKTDLDALGTRVGTAESSIAVNAGKVATKVEQSTFDSANKRLGTAETAITQQAKEIALKATKSDLDKATGRLTTAESAITVNADKIASKVEQADFNKVDNRLKTAESSITQQAGLIASKVSQTDFNKVEGRVKTAESTITQQANLIASKVAQTDFNKVAGRVTSAETAITQSKNEIALKASKTEAQGYAKNAVDGIQIGGRNYFSLSELSAIAPSNDWVVNSYFYEFYLEPNTNYIISSNVPNDGVRVLYFNENSITKAVHLENSPIVKSDESGYLYVAIPTGRTHTDGILNGTYWVQLEKGNKATDWTPAPEDIDKKIKTNETAITANADEIKLKANQTELATTSGNVAKAQAELIVQAGKIASKVEQTDFNKVDGRVKLAESQITQQAGLIATKVSQTDFDKVAGRVTSAETAITQTEKDIALKANQSTVNALGTRVGTAESAITANANAIKLKATQTDLDASNSRLTKAEGSITVNADAIKTKVAQSDFNAVNNRLKTAESSITQQAGEIATKVSNTTYEADINNPTTGLKKKMSNAESRITQTESAITSKVSQTTYDADINNATNGLKKKMSNAESQITQQAGLIASKVSSTTYTTDMAKKANSADVYKKSEIDTKVNAKADNATVNPLITRVTNAETKVTQHDSDISLRATKTEAQGYVQSAVEGVQSQINSIETRVSDAEMMITPESITATVIESEDFISKIDGYATSESLGDYATKQELENTENTISADIDRKINAIDYSPYVKASELQETSDSLTAKFSQAGGVNLIQNSIGWANADFWKQTSNKITTIQNNELASLGFGSAWYFDGSGTYSQRQTITLPRVGKYTLSFLMKKTAGASWASVQVQGGNSTSIAVGTSLAHNGMKHGDATLHDKYEQFSTTFETNQLEIDIVLYVYNGVEVAITGLMLNEGSEPFKWQPYTSEVYNANVKMDINGITVKNNKDAGYTVITPDEFSGYAPVEGNVERVFTLNGDTTEVKKLKAEQQFEMAPLTIITIDNLKYSGWAFI